MHPFTPQNNSSFFSQNKQAARSTKEGQKHTPAVTHTRRTHAWQIHQRCLPSQSPLPWLPGPVCHSDYTNSQTPSPSFAVSSLPSAVAQPAPRVHWGLRQHGAETVKHRRRQSRDWVVTVMTAKTLNAIRTANYFIIIFIIFPSKHIHDPAKQLPSRWTEMLMDGCLQLLETSSGQTNEKGLMQTSMA